MLFKKDVISIFEQKTNLKVHLANRTRLGKSSITYKITTNDDEVFYFKQGKNNYQIQFDLHFKLNNIGINTPEIIRFDREWMIQKEIKGNRLDLNNKKLSESVLTQFGKALSKVHSIKTKNYGELVNVSTGEYQRYSEYYERMRKFIPEKYVKALDFYINKKHSTCLNHGDIFPNHIFVDTKGNYKSLIDWDDAISAPNHFDLSELLKNIGNNENLWNCFMRGYSEQGEYISCYNKDILTAELLQTIESYYWHINDDIDNKTMKSIKKKRIEEIGNMLL